MGIDCDIIIRADVNPAGIVWPPGFRLEPADERDKEQCEGATHYVFSLMRYFGPYYERGWWPTICYVLLQLMTHPDVKKVWYAGDVHEHKPEVTPELIDELTNLWLSRKRDP